MRTLDKSIVMPGSKGMAIVLEEYLLLHLKMGSSASDTQGCREGPQVALAPETHHHPFRL